MLISATPLIVKDEVLDIFDRELRDLFRTRPMREVVGGQSEAGRIFDLLFYGLTASGRRQDGVELEVFRNAHVELRLLIDSRFIREMWSDNGGNFLFCSHLLNIRSAFCISLTSCIRRMDRLTHVSFN